MNDFLKKSTIYMYQWQPIESGIEGHFHNSIVISLEVFTEREFEK